MGLCDAVFWGVVQGIRCRETHRASTVAQDTDTAVDRVVAVEYLVAQQLTAVQSRFCHPPTAVVIHPPIGLRAGSHPLLALYYTVPVVSGPRWRMFRNAGRDIRNNILSSSPPRPSFLRPIPTNPMNPTNWG